jgi:hypothetical protein
MGNDWGEYNLDKMHETVNDQPGHARSGVDSFRIKNVLTKQEEKEEVVPQIFEPETFEEAVNTIMRELAQLMVSKQQDYGPLNIMESPHGPQTGLLVRMWDKFARLRNLAEAGKEPRNEAVEDTYKDIANYAIISLMVMRGWFVKPLRSK